MKLLKEPLYGVVCEVHGPQSLTWGEYDRQLKYPSRLWACPICGREAHWDDDAEEQWEAWAHAIDQQNEMRGK